MKRKIIICVIILAVLGIGITAAGMIVYHSDWASQRSDYVHGTTQSGFKFYPGHEYNSPAGGWIDIGENNENKKYIEYVVECQIETGALIFSIYDTNGADYEEKDKYTLVREERIEQSGTHVFQIDDLPDGRYHIVLDAEDGDLPAEEEYVVASGTLIRKNYASNWKYLIVRIRRFLNI